MVSRVIKGQEYGMTTVSYQLCFVLRLLHVTPHVLLLAQWWGQSHERDSAQPAGFDEWPDQEAIEVEVLPSTLAFRVAQLDLVNASGRVAPYTDDVVAFESSECLVQVDCQSFCREDEFSTEKLPSMSKTNPKEYRTNAPERGTKLA